MTKKKLHKIGSKVHVTVKRFGKNLEIDGVIKDIRPVGKSFGNTDYLITGGKVGDFYARNVK